MPGSVKKVSESYLSKMASAGAKVTRTGGTPRPQKQVSPLPRSRPKDTPPVSRELSGIGTLIDKQNQASRLQTAELLRGLIEEINSLNNNSRNLTFNIERSPDGLMQRIHVTETK